MKYVVNGVVILGDQVLLVKNKHLEGPDNEYWSLPGGGVEEGESLRQALQREMLEETGVKAKIGPLLFINEYKLDSETYAGPNFIFLINNPEDYEDADHSIASHSFELSDIKFMNIDTQEEVRPQWLQGEIKNINSSSPKYISDDNS